MSDFICKKCGSTEYEIKDKPNGTGIAHGLYCAECGFWHKWLGKEELKQYATKESKDEIIAKLQSENAALRERLEKAVEIPFVFNRDIIVILYDNKEIPKLINAKVVGIGIDTEMLFEGKIDIMLCVIDTFGDTHFFHGRQYQKEWFLTDDRVTAEKQLSERGGKNELLY